MTITENDLRDLFDADSGGGPCRGVTAADVDRRARRIRRRRLGAAGGAAAVGLAVAAALTMPAGTAEVVPEDVWTGVMSQPGATPRVVGTPQGEPFLTDENLGEADFQQGGVRKEVTVPTGGRRAIVIVVCEGALRKAVIWIDGRLAVAGPCGRGEGKDAYSTVWRAPENDTAIEHTVAAAVLPAHGASPEELGDTSGVEDLLARSGPFDAHWRLLARGLGVPECRDGVRQIDPATGEMVLVRCEDRPSGASGTP
jgi:hypothetical protein